MYGFCFATKKAVILISYDLTKNGRKQLLCRFTFSDVKHIYSIIYSSKPYYTHSKVFVFPKSKRGIRSCVKWQDYMVLHILRQILIHI